MSPDAHVHLVSAMVNLQVGWLLLDLGLGQADLFVDLGRAILVDQVELHAPPRVDHYPVSVVFRLAQFVLGIERHDQPLGVVSSVNLTSAYIAASAHASASAGSGSGEAMPVSHEAVKGLVANNGQIVALDTGVHSS